MKALKIGDLTATTPIIQGGMGVGISLEHSSMCLLGEIL